MTVQEIAATLTMVRLLWPHSNLGDDSQRVVALWHEMLDPYPRVEVEAAVRELAATGREHAPPVGMVARMTATRMADTPEFDQAWRETLRMVRRFGSQRVPAAESFSHPVVAAFARPAWSELCLGPAEGTSGYGTHYAQQREAYRAMAARADRDVALAALSAPRRSRVGLARPDFLQLLPGR